MEKKCKNCQYMREDILRDLYYCQLTTQMVINEMPEGGWKQGAVMGYSTGQTTFPESNCDKFKLKKI